MNHFTPHLGSTIFIVLLVGCQGSCEYDLSSGEMDERDNIEEELRNKSAEIILPALIPSQTRYADGYTEEAFRALQEGASHAKAKSALGEPLFERKCGPKAICWYYSEAAGEPENYFVRVLEFDQDGLLIEKHRSFYMD